MKILLVEKDESTRVTLAAVLRSLSHEVCVCADGPAAWSAWQARRFPAVILDWTLPGRESAELCAKIRDADGRLAVIIACCSATQTLDIHKILQADADDFISKPLDLKALSLRLAVAENQTRLRAGQSAAVESLSLQLRQSQKMEALGKLASGIAHDFNNLLTIIIGRANLLKEQIDGDHPARHDVDEIGGIAESAAVLTRQLMAFSRQQALQSQVLDLNAVVHEAASMLAPLIGTHIQLSAICAAALGAVKTDASQVKQIIMNLAINARDAMPVGGRILIETSNVTLDNDTSDLLLPVAPGPYVLLSVSDTGEGIPQEIRARVFEPFFTTKGQNKGTGLGLSTVHSIVKQHHGSIGVSSQVGHGTTFKIYLPLARELPAPHAAESPAATRKPADLLRGTETVLLVEDEEGIRKLVNEVLSAHGYNVLAAHDAKSALALANAHENAIALMISDVALPGMSGPEAARLLLAKRPLTKLVFTSGNIDDAQRQTETFGPQALFFQKPFSPTELLLKIRKLLDTPAAPSPAEISSLQMNIQDIL
jgi:signal transduction histidine kinase